jgi:hypothetical protein
VDGIEVAFRLFLEIISWRKIVFGHPVSKAGYALAVLSLVAGFSVSYFPHPVKSTIETLVLLGSIVSFSTVFLGVIARGFERVEAAILSKKMYDDPA